MLAGGALKMNMRPIDRLDCAHYTRKMTGKTALCLAVFTLPVWVFLGHITAPLNPFTPYLIPRLLPDAKIATAVLRRCGAAYLALGIWLIACLVSASAAHLLDPDLMTRGHWLAGAFFVVPMLALLSAVVGLYYLAIGLFSRGAAVRPDLEATGHVDPACLDGYVTKLKFWFVLSFLCLAALPLELAAVYAFDSAVSGPLVMINVAGLIVFLLAVGRVQLYTLRAGIILELPDEPVWEVAGWLVDLLDWVTIPRDALRVLRAHRQAKRASATRLPRA